MQRFVNDPDYIVEDMVKGYVKAHKDLIKRSEANDRVVQYVNAPVEGKVGLVTGGGSGHEPAFLGYVGKNMMDAVAVGEIFSSPSAQAFYDAFMSVDSGQGVACLFGNYAGDNMNVKMAIRKAKKQGVTVKYVVATDDVASSPKETKEKRGEKPKEKAARRVQTVDNTVLALKNNLLYDLALAPNIEIEIPVGKRWSVNMEYKSPWWSNSSKEICYQLISGGIESRYWLGNRELHNRLNGHFFGLYIEGGIYDFQFKGNGYQGKYYGAAGFTYGYSTLLSRHLALEFSLGIGYLTTEYQKYTPYEGSLVWMSSGNYTFIGPTKAKISLVWLITKKRGRK